MKLLAFNALSILPFKKRKQKERKKLKIRFEKSLRFFDFLFYETTFRNEMSLPNLVL
jgi:hypothetical protein